VTQLNHDFRQRRIKKTYHALLHGHVAVPEGEWDLPLERDPDHVPFMRVATVRNLTVGRRRERHKMLRVAPKPSLSSFRVLSWETLDDSYEPVTRVELTPHTGRTHQLRVHCAAMGHPIVGDSIYGPGGEGSPHGGLGPPGGEKEEGSPRYHRKDTMVSPRMLCLHARQLSLHHPCTKAPMIFSADGAF